MSLHLILEILSLCFGVMLTAATFKHTTKDFILLGAFGVFLASSALIRVVVSLLSPETSLDINVPITWLLPSIMIPFWIRTLSVSPKTLSPVLITAGVIILTFTLSTLLSLKIYYWHNTVVGRPLEAIPAILGIAAVGKVFNNNGKGKILTLSLVFFIISHISMMFSSTLYDSYFIMAHTLKLGWNLCLFLLLYNPKETILVNDIDSIVKSLKTTHKINYK